MLIIHVQLQLPAMRAQAITSMSWRDNIFDYKLRILENENP